MAIPPLWFPQLPWVFEVICGQDWPAGDEDALRRCAQAWDDALKSIATLAGDSDETALSTLSTVASMSADHFAAYWSQYTGTDISATALGQTAAQCQAMASALYGQANEVEYTKLMIDVTLVLTYIQLIILIASAVASFGTSLTAVPLLTLIARLSVQGLALRLLEMVAMMMLPDLIAQGWMLNVDHTATSWDGDKTKAAAENAVAGVVIGTLLGAGTGKLLGLAGEDFGRTLGGKAVTLGAHFIEGGATMDLAAVSAAWVNLGLAEQSGDKQQVQQAQQQWGQVTSGGSLLHQFASGGIMAAAFTAPHLGGHGIPLTFTGSDGTRYVVHLDDATARQLTTDGSLPDGFRAKAFDPSGKLVGTATFSGPDVSIDKPFSKPASADLTTGPGGQGGFQLTHDGQVQHWGYPPAGTDHGLAPDGTPAADRPSGTPDGTAAPGPQPKAQQLSYTVTSDKAVTVATPGAGDATMTGAKGSVLHYTPDGTLFRADLVDPANRNSIQTVQTADPSAPAFSVTGHQVLEYGPAGVGRALGLHGVTYYDASGNQVASVNALTGTMSFQGDGLARPGTQYMTAFGDHYDPLAASGAAQAHAAALAPFEPAAAPAAGSQATGAGADPGQADGQQAGGHPPPSASTPGVPLDVAAAGQNAALAAQQALQQHGEWAAMSGDAQAAGNPGRGTPPVYGRPETALEPAAKAGQLTPEVTEQIRNTEAGRKLLASRAEFEARRANQEADSLKSLANIERAMLTASEEQLPALRAARQEAVDAYVASVDRLAGEHVQAERQLLTEARSGVTGIAGDAAREARRQQIGDISREIRALEGQPRDQAAEQQLDALRQRRAGLIAQQDEAVQARRYYPQELQALDARYPRPQDVRNALLENLADQRSRAFEADQALLSQQLGHAGPGELPARLAELDSAYHRLWVPDDIAGQHAAVLAEKAAIDEAARAATADKYQEWVAAAAAVDPKAPQQVLDGALQRQDELFARYASAEASARVDAIEKRLGELRAQEQGPEVTAKARYLEEALRAARPWRDGIPAADPALPSPQAPEGTRPRTVIQQVLFDLANRTDAGRQIDQAVASVRQDLMSQSPDPTKVSAAGMLLLDGTRDSHGGLRQVWLDRTESGGEPAGEDHRHLRTADGASIAGRQNRYGVPGNRIVGSTPDRSADAEAVLLDRVINQLRQLRAGGEEPSGVLVVGSDKLICPSCQALFHDLGGEFPGIQVVLATDTESVVYDSHQAEQHPAWVWGSRDIGQLRHLQVGMDGATSPPATPPDAPAAGQPGPKAEIPLADVAEVTPPPGIDLNAARDPLATPEEFRALAEKMREQAAESGQMQAIAADASGQLHWLHGGSQGMLPPGLAGIDMGGHGGPGSPEGRILVRTTAEPVNLGDPAAAAAAAARLSPREHQDRTVIVPPEGNPVQLEWSARMDTLRSGQFIRPHDSPLDTAVTGPYLDAVTREAGVETLAGHGGAKGIDIGGGQEITPQQIAAVLPELREGTIWEALICDFGDPAKAGALADATGRAVRAADTPVVVNRAGQVAADTLDPATGKPRFATGQGHAPEGNWAEYRPGGHQAPAQPPAGHPPPAEDTSAGHPPSQDGQGGSWQRLGNETQPAQAPLLLPEPAPDILRLQDLAVQGLPKGVLAYQADPAALAEHADAAGAYYQVAGSEAIWPTRGEAMLDALKRFAGQLRGAARAEHVPPEVVAEFRRETALADQARDRMRKAFETTKAAEARAVRAQERAAGLEARAATLEGESAASAREQAARAREQAARAWEQARERWQQTVQEYQAAAAHEAAAAGLTRDVPILSNDERRELPAAAAALDVAGQLTVITGMRGAGDVRPALHPVVEELYEGARVAIEQQMRGIDHQLTVVTDDAGKTLLLKERARLADQLQQNGRCAEATALSEWAKELDEQLQRSDPGLTPFRRGQVILDILRQAHATSLAVDLRYGENVAGHGQAKPACANCEHVFAQAGIEDQAKYLRPPGVIELPGPAGHAPPGASLHYDPDHPGQLTATELAAMFSDPRNAIPPTVLRSWTLGATDLVSGDAVSRASLPGHFPLTSNEWTAALTAMVERIGTSPGLEYALAYHAGADGTGTLTLVEGGPTQVRPPDGSTLLAHSHPVMPGVDRPSVADILQLRAKPLEFEYLIAQDGEGHQALIRFDRDGSWTKIATFQDGTWRLEPGEVIASAAREGTFAAALDQRRQLAAQVTRIAAARASADLLAAGQPGGPSGLSAAERQAALADLRHGLDALAGVPGDLSAGLPPDLERIRVALATGADLTPADLALARDHLTAAQTAATADAAAAARQMRLAVPGLVAQAEDAHAYLDRLRFRHRAPGYIEDGIAQDLAAEAAGNTGRAGFNHKILVGSVYDAVSAAIRDLPDAPGRGELMARVVAGLADPGAFSDALLQLRDHGPASLTDAQRRLVGDTLDLVRSWHDTLAGSAAGKQVPPAPARDLTLTTPRLDAPAGLASADPPASRPPHGQQHGNPLELPKRIGPAELARRMTEFLGQQHHGETELAMLHQAIDRAETDLGHAMTDAAGGVPGADARVASLRQQLEDLNHRAQELSKKLNAFTRDLWDARARVGLRPGAREREAVNPELLHRRNVQRLYARDHGLAGPAWAGEPPVVPGADLLRDAQVLGRAEVPMMERVKRLVSLHGALEDAVREGQVTPLLPEGLKKQFDAFRAAGAPRDIEPSLLAERIAALRERIRQLPEYQRLDPAMQAYVDRLASEAHGEAQRLLGTAAGQGAPALPAPARQAAGGSLAGQLRQAVTHPFSAITQNVTGRLAYEILRTQDGGVYIRFSRLIDAFSLEENQWGAIRATLADLKLAELPLVQAGPIDLGLVAGLSSKYARTAGVEFRQPLDRGDAIAFKVAGPGERVITTSWDRMPVKDGRALITTDVSPVDKHTIKTDLKVAPAAFLHGATAEAPVEAKLSLEVSLSGGKWKVQGTIEGVTSIPQDPRKGLISAGMDWLRNGLGYPGWAPSAESSTEAAFVIGPVEFHKLPGYIRQQVSDHLASRGVTVTEEGTIPDDQIGQLAGTPAPAPVPGRAASLVPESPTPPAQLPPTTPRPAPTAQQAQQAQQAAEPSPILSALNPAPTADDRRVLPYGPAPAADDLRALPYGPAPTTDDRRQLSFGPPPRPSASEPGAPEEGS